MKDNKFNIALIIGSVRHNRDGIKVARWFEKLLNSRGHSVSFIDPVENQLPWLDKMYKEYEPGEAPATMEKLHKTLEKADGFVLVTPEYNHSTSPVMKNILDTFQKEFFQKPAGIVSYSAGGFGGIRAAEQLRLITIELGMTPTPISFPVSKIGDTFEEPGQPVEAKLESTTKRADKFLSEFEWYLEALKAQRAKGLPY